jgi:hypothetical protein
VTSPFRDAPISPSEVRRILRRAAELAERDPETASAERAMTRSELERAAADLGLPASAIARAIDHDENAEAAEEKGHWFLGGKTRIVLEREIPAEPSEREREDLIDEIREVMGDTGTLESVGNNLVWRTTVTRNAPQAFTIRIRFRDGRTRVVIEERLLGQAIGLFVGLGVGGGIGPMGGYIMACIKLGAIGLVFPLLWIPTMLLLARTIFAGMTRRHAKTMRETMNRIEQCATKWQGTRIAASEKTRVAEAEPLEAEAEQTHQSRA